MNTAEERLIFETLEFLVSRSIRQSDGPPDKDGNYKFETDDKLRGELMGSLHSAALRRPMY